MESSAGSQDRKTFRTILIDDHYQKLGLDRPWGSAKVRETASILKATVWELGKLCCVDFQTMQRLLTTGRFPPYIALHFQMLRAWHEHAVLKKELIPVMPVWQLPLQLNKE